PRWACQAPFSPFIHRRPRDFHPGFTIPMVPITREGSARWRILPGKLGQGSCDATVPKGRSAATRNRAILAERVGTIPAVSGVQGTRTERGNYVWTKNDRGGRWSTDARES